MNAEQYHRLRAIYFPRVIRKLICHMFGHAKQGKTITGTLSLLTLKWTPRCPRCMAEYPAAPSADKQGEQ